MDTEPRGFMLTARLDEPSLTVERRAGEPGLVRLTVDEGTGYLTVRQLGEILQGVKPDAEVVVNGLAVTGLLVSGDALSLDTE